MAEQSNSTLEKIRSAAMAEFLEKGYLGASLRNIVKTAGVTTGAFYGYYSSKPYLHVISAYRAAVFSFGELLPEEQVKHMGDTGKKCMRKLLSYMDSRRAEFHLILECAEGTPYSGMIDEMVSIEIAATERYCEVLRSLGKTVPEIDPRLEHILVTGMMNAYSEIIIHDMPLADAQRYLEELGDFYTAGWLKIMGQ